ncbi:hypothetical protein MRX96_021750 [Rhipicephalus microplus]
MSETAYDRPTSGTGGIAMVSTHLPLFRLQNPAAWFTHIEDIFALRRITSQQTKYQYTVSALSTYAVVEPTWADKVACKGEAHSAKSQGHSPQQPDPELAQAKEIQSLKEELAKQQASEFARG